MKQANIQKVSIDKINPAPYNPRITLKPSDPAYEKLKQSIEKFGLVEPLIWNKRTGNLVSGHQRLAILKKEGAKEVQVSVVNLSDSDEKALNMAMNKISGEWDHEALTVLMDELGAAGEDVFSLAGFQKQEIDDLITKLSIDFDDEILQSVLGRPDESKRETPEKAIKGFTVIKITVKNDLIAEKQIENLKTEWTSKGAKVEVITK